MELIELSNPDFPKHSYCVLSDAGIKILENVQSAEKSFHQLNFELSKDFFGALLQIKKFVDLTNLMEVSILRSGPFYRVKGAFKELTDKELPQTTLGIKRVKQKDGSFKAEVYFDDFSRTNACKKHVITSEIIASGCTLEKAFAEILKNYEVEEWTIFSVAASKKGAQLLAALEKKYNLTINLFVNGFIPGLAENNTDMPFYHKETIISPKIEAVLRENYGGELFEKIFCCIGDGGNRFCTPEQHYQEFINRYSSLSLSDEKSKKKLEAMISEAKQNLSP
ncbi:hypothetical protein HY643_02970 [Candidatus Woesearchaeota archaeon]|nr:hypothetical protein [Candidatus Woesearchaeota archaeon]